MRLSDLRAFALRPAVPLAGLLGLITIGCGASGEPPAATAAGTQGDAGARSSALPPPPSDVTMPAMRPVPPLTLASKVARVRGRTERTSAADALGDPPQPACAAATPATGDASSVSLALAKTCAPAMKPVGSPHTVSMSERDPAVVIPLVANRACYRVFATSPASVEGFVVVIVDSKGAIAAEGRTNGRTLVVPAEGPLCFEADDAAKIVTSAARGNGNGSVLLVRE